MREEFEWATGLPDAGPPLGENAWGRSTTLSTDGDPLEGRTFYGTGPYHVQPTEFKVRLARLRQGGDAIERQWVAQDLVCSQIQQCIQTIQLG